MPQSSRAWEKKSQKNYPFDPPEPVRITVELVTSGNRKRKINQYSKEARIGKGRHGEVYLCHMGDDIDKKAVSVLLFLLQIAPCNNVLVL